MTTSALRPRTVSEIVDAAFQIFKAHYLQFVMCSALAYLPRLAFELTLVGQMRALTLDPTDGTMLRFVGIGILSSFGIWITYALMTTFVITLASQAYLGETVDVGVAVRSALPKMPRILVAAALRFVLMMIGFMAFMVGAIYVLARYFALNEAILFEDAGIMRAFSRSSELSHNRKWHILNALGLVAIIFWVVAIGVSILAALSGSILVQTIVNGLFIVFAYPVIAITECLLYYDARIQSEGLDIELLAGDLAPPPAPAS